MKAAATSELWPWGKEEDLTICQVKGHGQRPMLMLVS